MASVSIFGSVEVTAKPSAEPRAVSSTSRTALMRSSMGAETVEPSAAVAFEAMVTVMALPLLSCSARRRREAHGLEISMSPASQPYCVASAALTAARSKLAHVTSSVISFSTTAALGKRPAARAGSDRSSFSVAIWARTSPRSSQSVRPFAGSRRTGAPLLASAASRAVALSPTKALRVARTLLRSSLSVISDFFASPTTAAASSSSSSSPADRVILSTPRTSRKRVVPFASIDRTWWLSFSVPEPSGAAGARTRRTSRGRADGLGDPPVRRRREPAFTKPPESSSPAVVAMGVLTVTVPSMARLKCFRISCCSFTRASSSAIFTAIASRFGECSGTEALIECTSPASVASEPSAVTPNSMREAPPSVRDSSSTAPSDSAWSTASAATSIAALYATSPPFCQSTLSFVASGSRLLIRPEIRRIRSQFVAFGAGIHNMTLA